MKTTDFMNKVTVEGLQKQLRSQHGVSVDIAKYSKAQLEDYSKKLGGKLKEFEVKTKFNESLKSDEYQKTLLIKKIVESAINQYIDNPLEDEDDLTDDIDVIDGTFEDADFQNFVSQLGEDDDEEEAEPEAEVEPEAEPEEKPAGLSPQAMAALKQLIDSPDMLGLARRGLDKVTNPEKPGALSPQEAEAIRGPIEKILMPIIDAGMQGISRSKPVLKTLGAEESVTNEGDNIYHSCVTSFKHKKFGEGKVISGEHTLLEDGTVTHYDATFTDNKGKEFIVRNIPVANMFETVTEGHGHKSKKKKIKEGAEEQAELTMAAKDMVDRFTSFLEDVAEMGAEGMLELADSIRDELGQEQSDAFVNTVKPALDAAQETLTTTREALNQGVGIITGEQQADDTIGAEPEGDIEEPMDAEVDAEAPMGMDDEFAASDAAAGGTEPEGREKRESVESKKKAVTESNNIFMKFAQ